MELIGLVGKSGSGKSHSLRFMRPEETAIITPKKLPQFEGSNSKFRKKADDKDKLYNLVVCPDVVDTFDSKGVRQKAGLNSWIKHFAENRPDIKQLIIEDITHYFNKITNSPTFRSRNKGGEAFARWGDFGADVYNGIFANTELYRDDLFLVTVFHEEQYNSPDGEKLKLKTPGNMLEKEVDIPSYYNYMFYTKVLSLDEEKDVTKRYKLITNDDGYRPAKSVFGVFEEIEIPNNMQVVIDKIKNFTSK